MNNAVTPEDVEAAIKSVEYVVLPDGRTTIALITLDNGFTVRGESACVDKANFDKAKGETYALSDAKRKIWPLLGFRLADRLSGHSLEYDQLYDKELTEILVFVENGETAQRYELGATFYDASTGRCKLFLEPYQPTTEGESE